MEKVKIAEGIYIVDLALYLSKDNALIFADFHLGYEESLTSKGVLIPRHQFKDTSRRVGKILEHFGKVDKIVITGDIKHEFGRITRQEWSDVIDLLDFMSAYAKEVILVKGNHDVVTKAVLDKTDAKMVDMIELGDIAILHGDKVLETKAKTLIIGHEHPAVTLSDGVTTEKFKCFIKGKYKRKGLIVLPSFNLITEGADILQSRKLSPYLDDVDNFEVWIVEDKIRYFGKVKNLI